MGDKVIPVKVAVRIRPLNDKEANEGCQAVLEQVQGEPQVYIQNTDPVKSFTYDYAYGGSDSNEEVYEGAVKKIVKQLFTGYNVTVLAYGQTGSGKTHSMGTAYNASDDPALHGVIPRSVRDIFRYILDNSDKSFRVGVSFMELYNEQLFDLLSTKPRREDTIVDIREDGNKGIKIPGLTEMDITSVEQTMALLEKASEGRVTAATAMNARSSRSHAIFTLSIESRTKTDGKLLTFSKFHMVDLAGSERQKKTKAKGERLKEGININMGLLSLGNVISALGEENRGANSHIPYRDSKLTRLLQDSLGGNSHTLMIACVSPADSNLEETISTLRYADRARKIKNKPIVNKDPRNEELGRLRNQVQQLQMQLLGRGGSSNVGQIDEEKSKELQEENELLREENSKMTTALQAAMDENSHMSEKLLLSEQSAESFKETLQSLTNEAADVMEFLSRCQGLPPGVKSKFEILMGKVQEVDENHKRTEKTLMDHDLSRFASSTNTSPCGSPSKEEDADGLNCSGANFALKHSELANQLSELNKMLVAKQELANKAGENDEKMMSMRKNYETTIKSMEDEISRLQKEKDELSQKQKAEGSNQVSEMRRKRIQELEEKIKNLSKQQAEQQRLLKLNKQNELKIKKYSDEITQMKQAKVKLIKQMKEESEKARQWKIAKEKEVYKLQQQEKKAQVKMSAMSLQHERRENVWKRKMEEAMASSKRLKEALAKKENVRKMKDDRNPTGLSGSGERVRGWISSEVDVVVSVKEAEMSKEQLIRERKMMSEEMTKLKQELRKTLSEQERNDVQVKRDELQSELDMRNAQISDLQQQILGFENDKEKEKDLRADKWKRLQSMVEAKLAVQYLFDQATEALASVALKSQELREANGQLIDLRKNNGELRETKSAMRRHHDEEIVRMEREHEEKILFLLRQLANKDPAESNDISLNKDISDVEEVIKFQAVELAKMSELHDQLMARDEEVANLKQELQKNATLGGGKLLPQIGRLSPIKNKNKRVTIKVERYETPEEFFDNEGFSSDDSDSDDSDDGDEEWRKTPLVRRIRQERKSMGGVLSKRKRDSLDSEEEDFQEGVNRKKSSLSGCGCAKGCKTKKCVCKKNGKWCIVLCKCDIHTCANREVPGTDVSSSVETDKENEEMDDTDQLLDSTYQLDPKTLVYNRSPMKTIFSPVNRNSGADNFAVDSDIEATPKAATQDRIFSRPDFDM